MFEIFGVTLYWYGFLIGIGIWLAMTIALYKRGDIKKESFEKVMRWVIIGGVVGARIYHVIDFWEEYYSSNLIKIFYFWEGGLGIWGAIIGGVICLYIYSLFNKLKFRKYLDSMVIGVPLAQALGRVGNFLNNELYGKNGEPLFFYEAVLNIFLFVILWKLSERPKRVGVLSGIYLSGYGVVRVLLEGIRPEEIIWKFYDVPVAMIFGVLAILLGILMIFWEKQS